MNTRDKVEWSSTPIGINQCHKVQGYENYDKIEIPVLFSLREDNVRGCVRVYDRETMTDYLNDILNKIEDHDIKKWRAKST